MLVEIVNLKVSCTSGCRGEGFFSSPFVTFQTDRISILWLSWHSLWMTSLECGSVLGTVGSPCYVTADRKG